MDRTGTRSGLAGPAGRAPQPHDQCRAGAGPGGEPGRLHPGGLRRRARRPAGRPPEPKRPRSSIPSNSWTPGSPRPRATWSSTRASFPAPSRPCSTRRAGWPSAVKEVEALAARVDLAQQNKAKITQQLETDKQKIADTKKLIGQIATQAYKSGGVPSNLSLFFGSNKRRKPDGHHRPRRPGDAQPERRDGQAHPAERHERQLPGPPRGGGSRNQGPQGQGRRRAGPGKAARDEAEAKKAQVDKLIADTTRLDAELQAAKPGIQSQLAQVKAAAGRRRRRNRRARPEAPRSLGSRAAAHRRGRRGRGRGGPGPGSPAATSPPRPGRRQPSGCGTPFSPASRSPPASAGARRRRAPSTSTARAATCTPASTSAPPAAPRSTPPAAGTVFSAGWANDGGGNNVKISHGVVQGNSLTTDLLPQLQRGGLPRASRSARASSSPIPEPPATPRAATRTSRPGSTAGPLIR